MDYSLHKHTIVNFDGKYKNTDKIIRLIQKNQEEIKCSEFVTERNGIFQIENFEKKFTLSGSFIVNSLDELGHSKDFFKEKKGRYFKKRNKETTEIYIRGPRYVLALDPHYSVIQKLNLYSEDIEDAIKHIKCFKDYDCNQFVEIAPILDYLKNALITLFNAYTHKEKQLQFDLDNNDYQKHRTLFLNSLLEATYCYYLSLVNKLQKNNIEKLLSTIDTETVSVITNTLKAEFKNFSFSSKSVVRAEASHPLILIGYSFKIAKKFKHYDLIFGLPSGSTELTCLIHKIITDYYKYNSNILCLIPISFHSLKNQNQPNFEQYDKVLDVMPVDNFLLKKAIVIDDNSATGVTIDKTKSLIQKKYADIKIDCSVAEADLIRIHLNLENNEKEYKYSNPELFKYSVGILPISKLIRRKCDLKEVIEERMLYHFYKNKKYNNLIEKIKSEVIADSIENKIDFTKFSYNNSNSIKVFQHTFLSNFYAVPIIYQNRLYSSVEQAYLRQKFDSEQLAKLNSKQKRELNEILLIKGIIIQQSNFSKAFNDFNYPAGVLKRFSKKLKEWGMEDKNWDDKRLNLMIELLIQKYSNESLMQKLLETGDKFLIEGNTWNDTFWGVCNGQGRNYLGRILMNIREKIIDGQIKMNNS